ncbi:MAG: extracellular solute-binding protein [Epulopiscium sp.]|nr:extracellular solute-binding protein [Candidatus Epulonipiscium sp.]
MKKKMDFFIASLMIVILVFSVTGCGKENKVNKVNSKGDERDDDPIDPIVWLTTGDMAAKPILPDDRIVEEINKRFSIDLQVQMVPEGDVTKVNIAMASGDFPDIVTGTFGSSATNQWINDGLLVSLNDYFESTPNLEKTLTEEFDWTTADDGNFYGYPFITQYKSTNTTLAFRQDWMDKLNLEVPKTLDDFYNVLKAFKEKDPDGNGEKDTYGITSIKPIGDFNFIFYAYGRKYADYQLDDNGDVIPHFEHFSFKPGMEYLRKLYVEGLIDPEFLLNDRNKMEERFYQSKVGYITAPLFRHVSRLEGNLQKMNPEGKLGYSYPPEGPDGNKGFAPVGKSGMYTAITKKCEAPKKAAQFIDFMISDEGKNLVRLGIEGIHYTKDGKEIIYNEEERAKDNFAENGWAHPLAWGSFSCPLESNYLPATEKSRERALESVEIASAVQVPNLITNIPMMEIEYGKIVEDLYNQYFIDMLQGKIEIDQGVAELSEKWRAQGGDKILEEVQVIYNNNK